MAVKMSQEEAIQEASHEKVTANQLDIVISDARHKNQLRQRQIQQLDNIHQAVEDRIGESSS